MNRPTPCNRVRHRRGSQLHFFALPRQRRTIGVVLFGLLAAAGCKTVTPPEPVTSIPPQSFVRGWSASVGNKQPLVDIHLVDDQLFLYSKDNQSYVFTASGGAVVYSDQIVPTGSPLRRPVVLPEGKVVYPVADALVLYDKEGRRLTSVALGKTTTGPGIAQGYTIYLGLSSETGGRLAALDLTPRSPTAEQAAAAKKMGVPIGPQFAQLITKWEVYTGSAIVGAPAFYQGIIYAGTEDGKVWAVNEGGSGIWELPDGSHTFQAAGPIRGDLKADDVGVYAASRDAHLYCIDRGSGRVKWTYYAAAPLNDAPVVSATTVYQAVPDVGLVAIDKRSGGIAKAKWFNNEAVKFLSEDEKYVYAYRKGGGVLALDKSTGLEAFHSKHRDLTLFAIDQKSSTIYGATAGGLLYSIKPVLLPGVVGQMAAGNAMGFEEIALAR